MKESILKGIMSWFLVIARELDSVAPQRTGELLYWRRKYFNDVYLKFRFVGKNLVTLSLKNESHK